MLLSAPVHVTTVGYCPVINGPYTEYSTIYTVLKTVHKKKKKEKKKKKKKKVTVLNSRIVLYHLTLLPFESKGNSVATNG